MSERELRARLELAQARRVQGLAEVERLATAPELAALREQLAALAPAQAALDAQAASQHQLVDTHRANREDLLRKTSEVSSPGVQAQVARVAAGLTGLLLGLAAAAPFLRFDFPLPFTLASAALGGWAGWRITRGW